MTAWFLPHIYTGKHMHSSPPSSLCTNDSIPLLAHLSAHRMFLSPSVLFCFVLFQSCMVIRNVDVLEFNHFISSRSLHCSLLVQLCMAIWIPSTWVSRELVTWHRHTDVLSQGLPALYSVKGTSSLLCCSASYQDLLGRLLVRIVVFCSLSCIFHFECSLVCFRVICTFFFELVHYLIFLLAFDILKI